MDTRKRLNKMLNLLSCAVALIFFSAISLAVIYEYRVIELDNQIKDLENQIALTESRLADRTLQLENTKIELDEAYKQLESYTVKPFEYRSAAAPLYDIPLSEELQQYTFYICRHYDISEYYEMVLALMWHESDFTVDAISSTDDYGLMQINKCNHKDLQENLGIVDILDPQSNIDGGVYILSTLIEKYEDMHKVLMAYNMGPSKAREHWSNGTYTSKYSRAVESKIDLLKELKIE